MRTKLAIAFILLIGSLGCGKDQFNTRPNLTFKSVNTTSITRNNFLTFELGFTDAEGDIQDTLWVNRRSVTNCNSTNFTEFYIIPAGVIATNNLKGVIEVCTFYGSNPPCIPIAGPRDNCANRNDTAVFRFWMRDRAGNRSDTVSSPPIAIIR